MKNRVQLIGHVGQDPEIKQLESGRVANFTIATNESYTNAKGEKVEQTEWHRVSAWGKTVDIIEQFLKKGSHVAIEGKLTHRNYDDKDGIKRYITEVVANEVVVLN
jgi:single-strand DNA-binding protein